MLSRNKSTSIERTIFGTYVNNETGHEIFMTIINEKRNYRELKESIRMAKSQRSLNEKKQPD